MSIAQATILPTIILSVTETPALPTTGYDPETLLDTAAAAKLLHLSKIWLKVMRGRGTGPKFLKLGDRCVRYNPIDIQVWLAERALTRKRVRGRGRKQLLLAANKPAFHAISI